VTFKIEVKDGRDGDKTAMRANSLVDELESVTDEESRAKARRFVHARQRLRSQCCYTLGTPME